MQGATGEALACEYLQEHGYQLRERNWRCKSGEIDLIMSAPVEPGVTEVRVIVEVRTRRQTTYGSGADTVYVSKQRKLVRAAKFYQQAAKWWGDIRFDVVSITVPVTGEPVIEHIPDAFGE